MAMISFAILFAFVGRASAAAMTTPTLTIVGQVQGVKPTSFTIGATATTEVPNAGTITITPAQPNFVVKTGIAVTLTGGTGTCTDTTAAVAGTGNPVMTITLGGACTIAAGGVWTAAITDQDALAVNPAVEVTSTMVSSTDADNLVGTAYTPLVGLTSVTEVPGSTNKGEKPPLVVSGTTSADATAALAAASTFVITSTVKIFEASQTFTSTQISMTGGTNCAIAAATGSEAIPILTVTLADAATSACAIAASTAVAITISENYFVPASAYTLSIAGAGTTVAASARTPTTAITEVFTFVDNQENGIKPTLIKYLFKNSGALAAAGTITITATESDGSTALAVFANSQTDTTVTVKSGATTPAAVLCGVSAVTSATNIMTITLSDSSTTCAIADAHVVEIDVSKADTIAVNPTGKTLAATITSSASATASYVAPGTYFTSGTKATVKSISDDGTSFIGGATTSASGALAATGTIHFFATTGLFKDQATSTSVTLTGGTNCEAKAVSAASAGGLYPGHSSMTVTLSDNTATCAIAVSTAFTVTAAGSSFLGTRPTTDTLKAGIMSTSSDVVAFEGATVLAITHKADPATTTTTNSSNSSNSTTTGLMMDDAPRLQGLKFFVAIFTLSFAAAL